MRATRRAVLLGGAGLVLAGAGVPDPDGPLFAALDAVGDLAADRFHPGRALAAATALLALPPAERVAALRRYLSARPDPPEGLFAVVRLLVEIPPLTAAKTEFPGVLQPGYLRPPALGASLPAEPADLRQVPRWPVIDLHDVPLVVVSGYQLGGQAEPLSMHLDGLQGATWRTALRPGPAGAVRMDLIHWGAWASDAAISAALEGQLRRYEGG